MQSAQDQSAFNSKALNALIHPYRYLDNHTNLLYIAMEYVTIAAILVPAVSFVHMHAAWGFSWLWTIPVVALTVMLIGGVQHRFAGLGHEGAHYIMLKNRFWNEFVSDFFCMFPLFSTTAQYRLLHLGHHEFVNDWEKDPELLNMGKTRMMDRFPMTRWEFIRLFFTRIVWPPASLRYMRDMFQIAALGKLQHPYGKQLEGTDGMWRGLRITSLLGIAYVIAMVVGIGVLSNVASIWFSPMVANLVMLASPVAYLAVAAFVIRAIPESWFFGSRLKAGYSVKFASFLRLTFITLLEFTFAEARHLTGFEWGVYFWLFWVLPLFTSFPYYMLLRDLYQHANADMGKLTNSRVIFVDPVTRWGMFIYGQDVHLTHHLYPAVPHYKLHDLHQMLLKNSPEYAAEVVECYGTFRNNKGKPTLLDVIEAPQKNPIRPPAPQVETLIDNRAHAETSAAPH